MEQSRINELISKGIKFEVMESEKKIKMGKRFLFDRGRGISDKCPKTDSEIKDIVTRYKAKIKALEKEEFTYMYEMEIGK